MNNRINTGLSDNELRISSIMSTREFTIPELTKQSVSYRTNRIASTLTTHLVSALLPIAPAGDCHEGNQPLVENPRIPRMGRAERAGRVAPGRSAHCVGHCSLRRTGLRQPVRTGDPAGSGNSSRQTTSGYRSAAAGKTRNLLPNLVSAELRQFCRRSVESSPKEALGQSPLPTCSTVEEGERQLISLSSAAHSFSLNSGGQL